jgi:hypothetical protein
MKLNIKRVFPKELARFEGFRPIRLITALYMFVMVGRSCIHLFAADGGAQSIAGIDTSVEGGDNIIAIFHQWGATQLLLALFLTLLFIRYPGMTPLIVLTLAVEPVMRLIAGQMKSVTADGAPPGESLNGLSFVFLAALFIASVLEKRTRKES